MLGSTYLGCQKQTAVALSSEFFFIRSRTSGHGSISSKSIVSEAADFRIQQKHAIGEDNQIFSTLGQNPVIHKRSKYIATHFHFNPDNTEDGSISISSVRTDKMAAGIFTKRIPVSKVEAFRTVLMISASTRSPKVRQGRHETS